ncbi:MAG TPA: ABC transporter permease [Thermoplasmata archaeon]|nr:ABC transporter permease [Thermoplasmata archaeon]
MRLWVYVVRRCMLLIPVLIGVMTITFALVTALPVSERLEVAFGANPKVPYTPTVPCAKLGIDKPGECSNPFYTNGLRLLGLNHPIPVQWAVYMYDTFTLRWGYVGNGSGLASAVPLVRGIPVTTAIGWFLPYTLELAALSLLMIIPLSISLGYLSAANRNRPVDQLSRILSFSGYALPSFLLGGVLLFVFVFLIGGPQGISPTCHSASAYFDLFGSWPPIQCWPGGLYPTWLQAGQVSSPTGFPTIDAMIHGQWFLAVDTLFRMILPAFVIAYGTIAGLLRFVRNNMLEVMNLDFVRTARAKGLPEKTVVKRHVGRNSVNVTVTVFGLTFAGFIGGFPIIESVFGLNGVGRLLAYSVSLTPLDFGMIFGSTILFTIIVVLANLTCDILYAVLDPRVRLG